MRGWIISKTGHVDDLLDSAQDRPQWKKVCTVTTISVKRLMMMIIMVMMMMIMIMMFLVC